MEIRERLKIFYERLAAVPPCSTAPEALALVCRLIEEVEDEFCPLPREDPPPRRPTGRMYAPRADSITIGDGGVLIAKTLGHRIKCFADGSIVIELSRGMIVEFRKAGATP